MTESPTVSIVIPLFNRASLIGQTLDSIASQTLESWEAIVVDDGSNDGGNEIVERRSQMDCRFRLLYRESSTKGANVCRNKGLEIAAGKYIIFLDSDDCLASRCLERRVNAFRTFAGFDFLVFQAELFDKVPGDLDIRWNVVKRSPSLLRFLLHDVPWQTTGPIWKREAIKSLGGFQADLPSYQDWELHVRALILNLKFRYIDEVDHFVRIGHTTRATIGNDANLNPHHLQQRHRMLKQVSQKLDEGRLWDRSVQQAFAFQCLLLCVQLCRVSRRQGVDCWRDLVRPGLISKFKWYVGLLAVAAQRTRAIAYPGVLMFRLFCPALWCRNTFCHPGLPSSAISRHRRSVILVEADR